MEAFPFNPAEEKVRLRDIWKSLTGYYPRPSSPDDNILDLALYVETILVDYINRKYRAGFISYAEGEELDLIGRDVFGVERLGPVPARTVLRFYLSRQTTIPKGTRVATKDMKVVFETEETASGTTQVDVRAVATEPGLKGNGYLPGEVSVLLDTVLGVDKVENIAVTTGGADIENDEHYRDRLRKSLERLSNAGSRGAYIFHAKSAHPRIGDVSVFSPSPGAVKVIFLLDDGSVPDQTYIDIVSSYLNAEKIRPLTDQVQVSAPTVINANVNARLYISDMTLQSLILESATESLNSYLDQVQKTVGKDLILSKIADVLHVHRAVEKVKVLDPPQDVIAGQDQVVKTGTVNLEVAEYVG